MVLEVNKLTKLYKNGRGVRDVSFSLGAGEVLGLLGPNGSGKTTTMKAVAGLVQHSAGTVLVNDVDAFSHHEKAMRQMGSLIEAPALYEHMTAGQNMRLAQRFYPDVDDQRVQEVLALVGLDKYAKDRTATFSLGMRQRLALGLALLSRPTLLVLDEPANGLDIEGMVYVREVVKKVAEEGAAVLISSHLAHEIELCATKVSILYDGLQLGGASMEEVLSVSPSLEDYFLAEVSKYRERGALV